MLFAPPRLVQRWEGKTAALCQPKVCTQLHGGHCTPGATESSEPTGCCAAPNLGCVTGSSGQASTCEIVGCKASVGDSCNASASNTDLLSCCRGGLSCENGICSGHATRNAICTVDDGQPCNTTANAFTDPENCCNSGQCIGGTCLQPICTQSNSDHCDPAATAFTIRSNAAQDFTTALRLV